MNLGLFFPIYLRSVFPKRGTCGERSFSFGVLCLYSHVSPDACHVLLDFCDILVVQKSTV